MIRKFKFYIDEYDEEDYYSEKELIETMEYERKEWSLNQFETGYYEL